MMARTPNRSKNPIRNLQRRLNQTTFLLVVGLGLMAAMTILSDPGTFKPKTAMERDLASVDDGEDKVLETLKSTSVLTLECSKKRDIVSWTQQIRLKGHLCREDGPGIQSTKIENTRNGYVATVFHQDREYTTDFIQLSEGENQLIVRHTLSDGQVEEMNFTVTRQQ
ncbi:MAG: hypothetical protein ABL958_01190 [Bdellovibrionia bacterium]